MYLSNRNRYHYHTVNLFNRYLSSILIALREQCSSQFDTAIDISIHLLPTHCTHTFLKPYRHPRNSHSFTDVLSKSSSRSIFSLLHSFHSVLYLRPRDLNSITFYSRLVVLLGCCKSLTFSVHSNPLFRLYLR